jgi:hypothetical protein
MRLDTIAMLGIAALAMSLANLDRIVDATPWPAISRLSDGSAVPYVVILVLCYVYAVVSHAEYLDQLEQGEWA